MEKTEAELQKKVQLRDMIARLAKTSRLRLGADRLCNKLQQHMIKGGGRFDNALNLLKDIKRGKFDLESDDKTT